jgi:hypothetical protein
MAAAVMAASPDHSYLVGGSGLPKDGPWNRRMARRYWPLPVRLDLSSSFGPGGRAAFPSIAVESRMDRTYWPLSVCLELATPLRPGSRGARSERRNDARLPHCTSPLDVRAKFNKRYLTEGYLAAGGLLEHRLWSRTRAWTYWPPLVHLDSSGSLVQVVGRSAWPPCDAAAG